MTSPSRHSSLDSIDPGFLTEAAEYIDNSVMEGRLSRQRIKDLVVETFKKKLRSAVVIQAFHFLLKGSSSLNIQSQETICKWIEDSEKESMYPQALLTYKKQVAQSLEQNIDLKKYKRVHYFEQVHVDFILDKIIEYEKSKSGVRFSRFLDTDVIPQFAVKFNAFMGKRTPNKLRSFWRTDKIPSNVTNDIAFGHIIDKLNNYRSRHERAQAKKEGSDIFTDILGILESLESLDLPDLENAAQENLPRLMTFNKNLSPSIKSKLKTILEYTDKQKILGIIEDSLNEQPTGTNQECSKG